MFSAAEGVLAVAPGAAHGTAGEPHKRARPSGVSRFTLNRSEDLSYAKHPEILVFRPAVVDLGSHPVLLPNRPATYH